MQLVIRYLAIFQAFRQLCTLYYTCMRCMIIIGILWICINSSKKNKKKKKKTSSTQSLIVHTLVKW